MQPIIKKENILFDVKAKNKEDMINQMVGLFSKGDIYRIDRIRKDVLARKKYFQQDGIRSSLPEKQRCKNAGLCVVKLKCNPMDR